MGDRHVFTLQPAGLHYRAVCTCGWRSDRYAFIGHAERAGAAHVKAKEHAEPRTPAEET